MRQAVNSQNYIRDIWSADLSAPPVPVERPKSPAVVPADPEVPPTPAPDLPQTDTPDDVPQVEPNQCPIWRK